jgi:type VI secretion system protein ImpK
MMFDSTVALMRATALHAALLSDGAEIPAVPFWRARCNTLVETLRQEMEDRSFPVTDIQEVCLAQCALLDELTLHALPSRQQEEWLRDTLQMRFHGVRDGAERVWERIDALVDGGHQDVSRLEFYSVLLELGFNGRREDSIAFRERVKWALNRHRRDEAVSSVPGSPEAAMTLANSRRQFGISRVSRARKTVLGVIAGLIAMASLWTAFDAALDAAIRRLPQTSATQSDPTERSQ